MRGTGDGHGNAWNSNYVANPLGSHHRRDDLDNDTYITPALAIRTAQTGANGWGVGTDEQAYTLDWAQGQAVIHPALGARDGNGVGFDYEDGRLVVSPTLQAEMYHHGGIPNQTTNGNAGLQQASVAGVRRLTPLECNRLQGFPDDWDRWTSDGREIADSHRYRMMGNAVAVPVVEWIGRRLVEVDSWAVAFNGPARGETQ